MTPGASPCRSHHRIRQRDGWPLLPNPPAGQTDPRVAEVTRAAGQALVKAGFTVEEVEPPRYEEVVAVWADLLLADIRVSLPLISPIMGADANKFLQFADEIFAPSTLGRLCSILDAAQLTPEGLGRVFHPMGRGSVARLDPTALQAWLRRQFVGGRQGGPGVVPSSHAGQCLGVAFGRSAGRVGGRPARGCVGDRGHYGTT